MATRARKTAKIRATPFDAREVAAYTLGVQADLWAVPFVEYAKTGVGGLKARAAALNSSHKYLRKYLALRTVAALG